MTPVHQLCLFASGKGVVWEVEIYVGTLPPWDLWFLRFLPGPLLALQLTQLVQKERHHALASSEGCLGPLFTRTVCPGPSVCLWV